mmetsp:Transcript_21047/g.54382  ORF Transcript_21047/g.54382 Transcript_21047/m.54382 type:complete len:330 (-) Transcript_21047:7162-8151(-)
MARAREDRGINRSGQEAKAVQIAKARTALGSAPRETEHWTEGEIFGSIPSSVWILVQRRKRRGRPPRWFRRPFSGPLVLLFSTAPFFSPGEKEEKRETSPDRSRGPPSPFPSIGKRTGPFAFPTLCNAPILCKAVGSTRTTARSSVYTFGCELRQTTQIPLLGDFPRRRAPRMRRLERRRSVILSEEETRAHRCPNGEGERRRKGGAADVSTKSVCPCVPSDTIRVFPPPLSTASRTESWATVETEKTTVTVKEKGTETEADRTGNRGEGTEAVVREGGEREAKVGRRKRGEGGTLSETGRGAEGRPDETSVFLWIQLCEDSSAPVRPP